MADVGRGRRASAPVLVLVTVGLVASGLAMDPSPSSAQDAYDPVAVACSMPPAHVERARNGWNADRGPDVMWFPEEPDFVGSGLPHVGVWDYIQHIPMFWYGPGHVAARGPVAREVTLADVAPTHAALTRFPFEAPDGAPMHEALDPEATEPPRLIVTIVWDAVGRNVLDEHPGRWPFLESLIPHGTWYDQAFVGYSPTSTAQAHATMGTGASPAAHGLVGHRLRIGGEITTPWAIGPEFWVLPTFADLYDAAHGNRPVVGIAATLDIHFGMMSHGAFWKGGDRDIVLTRTGSGAFTIADEGTVWNLRHEYQPYYRLADYANDVPGFEDDVAEVDRNDGELDGRWRDNDIEQLLSGFNTPARSPYQQRVIEEMFRREGFGRDRVTDLLFTNFKVTDYVSHVWSMNSAEMGDALEAQDRQLERLASFLDDTVGAGEWVLALTSDHAAMPDPSTTGAFQISTGVVERLVNERFDGDDDDRPVTELVHPTAVFIDERELAERGASLEDVAAFAMTLTRSQVAGKGVEVPPGTEDELAFPWAFPSNVLGDLRCG